MIGLFLFTVLIVGASHATYSPKELRCLVCKTVIIEMEKEIAKINPNKKINLGHRINNNGEVMERTKPYARSEMHLSELMDSICDKMENYVRAKNKSTGELDIIALMTDSGQMNPRFTEYEIIQDSDLNKSLKFYCEGIVEEYEKQIYDVLKEETQSSEINVCGVATELCDINQFRNKDEL